MVYCIVPRPQVPGTPAVGCLLRCPRQEVCFISIHVGRAAEQSRAGLPTWVGLRAIERERERESDPYTAKSTDCSSDVYCVCPAAARRRGWHTRTDLSLRIYGRRPHECWN